MGPLADFRVSKGKNKVNLLKWIDEVETERKTKGKEALKLNDFKDDLLNLKEIPKVQNHKEKTDVKHSLRSRRFTMS